MAKSETTAAPGGGGWINPLPSPLLLLSSRLGEKYEIDKYKIEKCIWDYATDEFASYQPSDFKRGKMETLLEQYARQRVLFMTDDKEPLPGWLDELIEDIVENAFVELYDRAYD